MRPSAGAPPCRSDFDCKLDRVCDEGRCVWPSGPGTPTAPRARAAAPAARGAGGREPEPTAQATAAGDGVDAQAMFRLDPQHRGRSRYRLPVRRPEVRWTYETRGSVSSSPAVSAQGWVVVGSQDGRGAFHQPRRHACWVFLTQDMVFGSPAISASGVVYIGSDDDHLYALDPKARQGAVAVPARAPAGPGPPGRTTAAATPTAGRPSGPTARSTWAATGSTPSTRTGRLKWRFATGGHVSAAPSLLPDGTVVVGCQDNLIYAHRARRDQTLGLPRRRRRRVDPGHRRRRHHLRRVRRPEAVCPGPRRGAALGLQRRRGHPGLAGAGPGRDDVRRALSTA